MASMIASMTLVWAFFVVGLVLILTELVVGVYTGFDLVLIGFSFLVGALVGYLVPVPALVIGVTLVILAAYFIFGRSVIKKRLYIATHKSNIDALIGRHGVVIKEIKPMHAGQVKIKGEIWRAESQVNLLPGDKVEVVGIEGVSLQVKKVKVKKEAK